MSHALDRRGVLGLDTAQKRFQEKWGDACLVATQQNIYRFSARESALCKEFDWIIVSVRR
ncbi:MAG: hypothetical protein P8Y67_09605 [Alphaproteobacteria bacterium]